MKSILLAMSVILSSNALADTPFSSKLDCTVSSLKGRVISFLPPAVGDQITLDMSAPSLTDVEFKGGNNVPVQNPLVPYRAARTPDYVAVFKSEQENSNLEQSSVVVMAGKFFDGTKDVYSGEIQQIFTSVDTGLVMVASVLLKCELSVLPVGTH